MCSSFLVLHERFSVGQTIGQAMVKYKLADDPEPTTFTKEEIDKYFGGVSVAALGKEFTILTLRIVFCLTV